MYLVCFRRGCKYKAPAWVDCGRLEFWTRIILLLCHLKASLLSKYFSEIIQFTTFSTLWLPSLSHEKVNLVKDPGKKRQTNHMCIFIQTLGEKTLEKNIHGKKETDRQTKRTCISIQTVVPPLYLIFQNCKTKMRPTTLAYNLPGGTHFVNSFIPIFHGTSMDFPWSLNGFSVEFVGFECDDEYAIRETKRRKTANITRWCCLLLRFQIPVSEWWMLLIWHSWRVFDEKIIKICSLFIIPYNFAC